MLTEGVNVNIVTRWKNSDGWRRERQINGKQVEHFGSGGLRAVGGVGRRDGGC